MNIQQAIIAYSQSEQVLTDVIFQEDSPVMVRKPTGWQEDARGELCLREDLEELAKALAGENWRATLKQEGSINVSRVLSNCTIRVNMYWANSGKTLCAVVRRHPLAPPSIKDLNLPQHIVQWLALGKGLILVTGPTGSGKTTVVAAMLNAIAEERPSHIITIEDPIEFRLQPAQGVVSSKEVPFDTPTFARGVKDAMRQKPDVIMVGELRDWETLDAALFAAESGHLAIATMHTNGAVSAISKALSLGPPSEFQQRAYALSSNLIGIVSQAMMASTDNTGYVMTSEILTNTPQTAKAIQDGAPGLARLNEIMARPDEKRCRLLNDTLVALYKEGKITLKEALRTTYDRMALQAAVMGSGPK